jgi:hypothetical protein
VGPACPDDRYLLEVIGTVRPAPLSPDNDYTYLTNFLPPLRFAATLIFLTGWQQNFGFQADNPQMTVSWEAQYKTLFDSINVEEQRKRYAAGAWASLWPTPVAHQLAKPTTAASHRSDNGPFLLGELPWLIKPLTFCSPPRRAAQTPALDLDHGAQNIVVSNAALTLNSQDR